MSSTHFVETVACYLFLSGSECSFAYCGIVTSHRLLEIKIEFHSNDKFPRANTCECAPSKRNHSGTCHNSLLRTVHQSEHLSWVQQGSLLAPTLDFVPVETRHWTLVHDSSPWGGGKMWQGARLQAERGHCCSPQTWQLDLSLEGKPLEEIHILAMEFIPWLTLVGYPCSYYKQQQSCCSWEVVFPLFINSALGELIGAPWRFPFWESRL